MGKGIKNKILWLVVATALIWRASSLVPQTKDIDWRGQGEESAEYEECYDGFFVDTPEPPEYKGTQKIITDPMYGGRQTTANMCGGFWRVQINDGEE